MSTNEIDWNALPISSLTLAEVRSFIETLTRQMADIEGQLDLADAKRQTGEYIDPIWHSRARTALKHRGRIHQMLAQRLGELNRESRRVGAYRFERLFVSAARELLTPAQFTMIFEAAHVKMRDSAESSDAA